MLRAVEGPSLILGGYFSGCFVGYFGPRQAHVIRQE